MYPSIYETKSRGIIKCFLLLMQERSEEVGVITNHEEWIRVFANSHYLMIKELLNDIAIGPYIKCEDKSHEDGKIFCKKHNGGGLDLEVVYFLFCATCGKVIVSEQENIILQNGGQMNNDDEWKEGWDKGNTDSDRFKDSDDELENLEDCDESF